MIIIEVSFCVSNLANGSEAARKQLEKDPDIEITEHGCLRLCSQCRQYHVAVVNGYSIKATTPDQLVDAIYDYIDHELFHN